MSPRVGNRKRKASTERADLSNTNAPEHVFSCQIESSKILSDVLNCLVDASRKDQLCYFEATSDSKILTYLNYLIYFHLLLCIFMVH